MNCETCKALLLDYELELLDAPNRGAVAQHLLACAACRTELDHLRLARAHLAAWPDQEPSADLAQRTLERLEQAGVEEQELPRVSSAAADLESFGAWLLRFFRGPEQEPLEPPRRSPLFRPLLSPLAACALLAVGGAYAHLDAMRVRLGAELYGAETLAPGAMSVVRLSLFDVETREPLPERPVEVELRDEKGKARALYRGESDAHGQVSARLDATQLPEGAYHLLVRAVDGRDQTAISRPVQLKRSYRLLLSTDKPLYQPGQTIHARVLAYETATQRPAKGQELVFSAFDPRGSRIYKKTVAVDAYGSASFDLPLAEQLNLGPYKVEAALGDTSSEADVQVARYSLPKFQVQLDLDQPYVRPGGTVSGHVRARYFFGKPVAGAEVKLEAEVPGPERTQVAAQTARTDKDGIASFTFGLPERLPGVQRLEGTALLQLAANVTSAGGEGGERHAELLVSAQPLVLSAIPENGALVPGLENRLLVLVARPDGQPVARAQVSLDGAGSAVESGDDGVAVLPFQPVAGRRDVTVTAQAPDGTRVSKWMELGKEEGFALLRTERSLYQAGETVRGTVASSTPLGQAYLDVVADGRTVLTQTLPLQHGQAAFAFDLPSELKGGVALELYARQGEEVRRVRKLLYVSDPRGLKVEVSLERESYKPGEPARLHFRVADEQGRPTAAGLGVSVVDESVFALAQKDPVLLRAFLNLAEELRQPRFSQDATQVLASGSKQNAAALLLSASELPSTVHPLGATDAVELRERRSAMASFKAERSGQLWLLGLFALGLLLEGILRRGLRVAARLAWHTAFGRVLLGAVASGGLAALLDAPGTGLWVGGGVAVIGGLGVGLRAAYRGGGSGGMLAMVGGVCLVLALGVTVFGDNLRRMFGASANALAGTAETTAARPRSSTHRNVVNFAAYPVDDLPAGRADMVPPAPPPVDNLQGHGFRGAHTDALQTRRQQTLRGAEGSGEDEGAKGPLSAEEKARVRVRSFFPETLFWAPQVVTDGRGEATVTLPGADSITTWKAAVVASSADGRLGAGSVALKVFQDFFVDVELPPVLTVGDEVEIPIAVHSYLDHPEQVRLEVEPAGWFEARSLQAATLTLQPDQVASIKVRLRATQFGPAQPLTVYAVGPKGKDAIRREVEVRPAGVPFAQVATGEVGQNLAAHLSLPADAVPGATHVELRMYPSALSAVLDGLENVLRMPSGCFEQTSSTTYPNALVLEYLKGQNKSAPELLARGEAYLTTGYQRLLSYEVQGGGFEWFGRAPANRILTAYGLLEFHDMAQVFPVDPRVIERTQDFLVGQQQLDGSWQADAEALRDGVYRDTFRGALTTTAYVTWALAESGYRGTATDRALRYLLARSTGNLDLYTRALIAVAALDLDPLRGRALAKQLLAEHEVGAHGVFFFPAEGATATASRGTSADVETTALVASALIKAHEEEAARATLRWLLLARDPHGTWGSTQATVLALRTLLDPASRDLLGVTQGTLWVRSGSRAEKVTFWADHADVMQRLDLTSWAEGGALDLQFSGDALVKYELVATGYQPASPAEKPALSLELGYDRARVGVNETIQARLTASYQRPEASGMVLIQAAIPPGFEPVASDLEKLVAQRQVARYASDGKVLTFYVDRLQAGSPLQLRYGLRARLPVHATAPASSAYLYYRPEVRAESRPQVLTVASR